MSSSGLPHARDAYGQLIRAYFETGEGQEIVERDDGFIEANLGPASYFEPLRRWPRVERRALRYVRGRALDVGCGAGRVALEALSAGTGRHVHRLVFDRGPYYAAVLERDRHGPCGARG